jgi:hypothetical protein
MSNDQRRPPLRVWLPKVVLTSLVFFVLVFVVYRTTVGLGERDLGRRSMWALVVAMGLLLLPAVDRIQRPTTTCGSIPTSTRERSRCAWDGCWGWS